MTIPVNMNIVGTVQTSAERTTSAVQSVYNGHINVINSILNSTTAPTVQNAIDYNAALYGLFDLASNGVTRVTFQMANAIQALSTFTFSINPTGYLSTASTDDIAALKNLMGQGLSSIVNTAALAGGTVAVTSLQSYIQLEYINTGNTLINNELYQLKEALQANKDAIDLLASIQRLKNGVLVGANGSVIKSGGVPVSFLKVQTIKYTKASLWGANQGLSFTRTTKQAYSIPEVYIDAVSPELGHRIIINIKGSSSIVENIQTAGLSLISKIQEMLPKLAQLSPPTTPPDGTTLGEQLQKIMIDMIGNGQPDNVVRWVLDNYDDQNVTLPNGTVVPSSAFNVANAGDFQRTLTGAVTTAQTTNSALNVQLSQTLFIFSEFYQSASSVLKQVHNMIVQIARDSARK